MIAVAIDFAPSGDPAALTDQLSTMLADVSDADGFVDGHVLVDDEANTVTLLERWHSREQHERYVAALSAAGGMRDVMKLIAQPPATRVLRVVSSSDR